MRFSWINITLILPPGFDKNKIIIQEKVYYEKNFIVNLIHLLPLKVSRLIHHRLKSKIYFPNSSEINPEPSLE
jgi:hypothetical protein